MLAESRPSAASLDCCTFSASTAGVLEEDQHRAGLRAAQLREMRLDQPRAIRGGKGAGLRLACRCWRQPASRNSRRGEHFAQQRAGPGIGIAQHLGGRFVDQADAVLRRPPRGCSRAGAARCTATAAPGWPGPLPAGAPAPRSRCSRLASGRTEQRGDEDDGAQHAGGEVPAAIAAVAAGCTTICCTSTRDAGDRRHEEGVAVAGQQRHRRRWAAAAGCPGRWPRRRPAQSTKPMAIESTRACVSASTRRPDDGQRGAARSGRCPPGNTARRSQPSRAGAAMSKHVSRATANSAGNEQPAGHQQAVQVDQPDDAPGQVRRRGFRAERLCPLAIAHRRGL